MDESPRSITVQAGKTARLKCEFLSWKPEWKMVWKMNEMVVQIQKEKRYHQRKWKFAQLRIEKVVKADSGMYECIASNDYANVSKRLNLTVVGKFL